MNSPETLASELFSWARAHPWYGRQAAKLKAKHEAYAIRLLSRMNDLSGQAMNCAWASLPDAEKCRDAEGRLVCELIEAFANACERAEWDAADRRIGSTSP